MSVAIGEGVIQRWTSIYPRTVERDVGTVCIEIPKGTVAEEGEEKKLLRERAGAKGQFIRVSFIN
jgi:hypothetical protein